MQYHVIGSPLLMLGVIILACQLVGCGFFKETTDKASEETPPLFQTDPVHYETSIQATDIPNAEASTLCSAMERHSQLILLKDQLPDGILELTRRARNDQQNAIKLLHSLGYYEGTAEILISEAQENDAPAHVTLILHPGVRYHLGNTELSYHSSPLPPFDGTSINKLPQKLEGLEYGQPAEADTILSAVSALPKKLQTSGYPQASIYSTRYTLNRNDKTLNTQVVIDPGPAAVMGDVQVSGTSKVSPDYIKKYVTWQKGEQWDSNKLLLYREELQKLGLFRTVDVRPAELLNTSANSIQELPTIVQVQESNFRTLGASARYATDDGIGIQTEWQHRNLFGSGEKLDLTLPFAQDKRGVQVDFSKNFFGNKDQKLLAGTSYLKEETDAYDTAALNAYVGLERRLSSHWWASIKLFGENGSVTQDNKKNYHYESLITTLRRDTRNNIMHPVSGTHIQWDINPTTGYYDGNFTGVLTRMSAAGYYTPFSDDVLILAGRLALGSFLGTDLKNIPPSLRFYCGGGGSVRGYSYQAIGPKDKKGDPLGGRSYQEINLEARFRVTQDIGIVPFLDGGMVYTNEMPELFRDMQWAAGIGLRYYTTIGPIRFDVALPLNKKEDDRGYQIYISIGQAF